jgi:hypothetical protein
MGLFSERRRCAKCGNDVVKPRITDSMKCPHCGQDGPWDVQGDVGNWKVVPYEALSGETFELADGDHDVGDVGCPACSGPYPKRCKCGGILHGGINYERGQDLMLTEGRQAFDLRCEACGWMGQSVEQQPEPTPEDHARIVDYLRARGKLKGTIFDPDAQS